MSSWFFICDLVVQKEIYLQYTPAYSIVKLSSFLYNYLICHILWFKIIFHFTDIYISYYTSFCFLFVNNLSNESIFFSVFTHELFFIFTRNCFFFPNATILIILTVCLVLIMCKAINGYECIFTTIFSSFEYFSSSVSSV